MLDFHGLFSNLPSEGPRLPIEPAKNLRLRKLTRSSRSFLMAYFLSLNWV